MNMKVVEILLLITAAAVIVLLLFLLRRRRVDAVKNRSSKPAPQGGSAAVPFNEERVRPCPLCGHMLRKGETVHTKVYPGKPDQIANIYGCPYCYPSNADDPRICPVCGKTVSPEGYVIARMFVQGTRKHVHVLGCTGCRRRG